MTDDRPTDFPRWRVWWRAYNATEGTLGSLPVTLVVPILAALVGTALAVSRPSEVVRKGLIVRQASFGGVLVTALIGGLLGLLVLIGVVFMSVLARYRLAGDRTWKPGLAHGRAASLATLSCETEPPVNVSALGHVEAIIRVPSGSFSRIQHDGMGGDPRSLWFHVPRVTDRPEPGDYEVRWYGTTGRHKRYEITRKRFALT
jgi:hypothetical protein